MTDLERQIENLVDEHAIELVLEALHGVCLAKAEDARENRQNDSLGDWWEIVAMGLENTTAVAEDV